jgi:hypothetical protein
MIQEDGNDLVAEKTFEEEQVTETEDKKGARIEDAGYWGGEKTCAWLLQGWGDIP